MQIRKSNSKFRKLRDKYLSSKAAALFFLNRKANNLKENGFDFGKLTDMELDRGKKEILLEITDGEGVTTVGMTGYDFCYRKGDPWLIWKSISCEGAAEERYHQLFRKMGGIKLSKKYFSLVEAVL